MDDDRRAAPVGLRPDLGARRFLSRLDEGVDLILCDCALPQFTGLQALEAVRARRLDVPFILVSGTIAEDVAAEAMRNGADDYVSKDRLDRLGRAAQQALRRKRERERGPAERREAGLISAGWDVSARRSGRLTC